MKTPASKKYILNQLRRFCGLNRMIPLSSGSFGVILLAVLVSGARVYAASFVNEDLTINRTSGTVGGNVGIGTVSPTARLEIKAFTHNSPPLLRVQGRSEGVTLFNPNDYDSPLLQIEREGTSTFGGPNNIFSPVFTVSSRGRVGVNIGSPAALLHIRDTFSLNEKTFLIDDNNVKRSFFVVPRLSTHGYNDHSVSGDAGIFWSDGLSGGGTNASSGFVIGPWKNTLSGLRVTAEGNVGIGTPLNSNPNNYKLAVNGKIGAREIQVEITSPAWPDFVFEDGYETMALEDLEVFIRKERHLPGIPSADEVRNNGVQLGQMNAALLKQIEELTLHMIDLKKECGRLQKRLDVLEKQ
jgi:hypothetical protein